MLSHVHRMLDCQGQLISTGDFGRAADFYDMPLSLHVEGDLLVYRARADFLQGLQTLIGDYRASGVLSLRWNIAAIELVRDRRFRLWVAWDHIFSDRVHASATEMTYYCRLGADRLHIEMVQYQAMAPAILATQIQQTAQTR